MQQLTQVLLVEDSPTDLDMLRRLFDRADQNTWQLANVDTLDEAILACQSYAEISPDATTFDIVLLDLGLPDSAGLDTLRQFLEAVPQAPVVVLTGLDDEAMALQAIEAGAQDYLMKPQVSMPRLQHTIRFAIERQQVVRQLHETAVQSRQALALERELNALRTGFIEVVSREFRDPLGVIQNAADLLGLPVEPPIDPKQASLVQKIQQSSCHLLELMNDVVSFSCLQANTFVPSLAMCDVAQCGQALIDQARGDLQPRQRLLFELKGDDLTLVYTDRHLLCTLLRNLIANAIKYSPQGGDITVQVQVTSDQLVCRVVDSGMGIPESERDRFWRGFYRASNVGDIPGTGMGLAIVKCCVDILQGDVSIISRVNVGTTVMVRLPIDVGPSMAIASDVGRQ